MKQVIILLSSLLLTLSALAQNTRSEFFYQAVEGEAFVQANAAHFKYSLVNDVGDVDLKDTNILLNFEMGLTEAIAVYGIMGYGSGNVGEMKQEGLNPIHVGGKFRMAAGKGEFFSKANLGLGILSKYDCDSTQNCNRTDQSMNLSVQVGYLMNLETYLLGVALEAGLFSTDGKVKNSTNDVERKSGFSITAFYEWIKKEDALFGASLSYVAAGVNGNQNLGIYIRNFELNTIDGSADIATLNLYTRMTLSEDLFFLGSIHYDHVLSFKNDQLDSGRSYGANLGLRLLL